MFTMTVIVGLNYARVLSEGKNALKARTLSKGGRKKLK